MAKTPKPDKDKGVLSHRACSDYPDCESKPYGCMLQFMRKDKKTELGKEKPKKDKQKDI